MAGDRLTYAVVAVNRQGRPAAYLQITGGQGLVDAERVAADYRVRYPQVDYLVVPDDGWRGSGARG